jgi:hypothetical protein
MVTRGPVPIGAKRQRVLATDCCLACEDVSFSYECHRRHICRQSRANPIQEWLQTKRPAEEVLIIGATLGAANEIARGLALPSLKKRRSIAVHAAAAA